MLALQYRLNDGKNNGLNAREVNQLFIHINNVLSEHNIKETFFAIPDTCSLISMDLYELKAIRNFIDKVIKAEEENNDNREPS